MEDELPEGETVEIEVEVPEVEDTEDGGAIVRIDEEIDRESEFYENLAEHLPEDGLKAMANELLELISRDKEARALRDKQYEEGLRRTGLGDDAPGGAQFTGASRVVHPMLTEVCVDFSSRAIKELFPASGPAKMHIVGELTKERVEKAKRKAAYMNWQLTTQSQEFRSELEQLLTQVPLGGAQYMKVTWNEAKNRPNFMFVAIDDIYLPFAATNFYSAQRKTHVQYLTELDYRQRVKSGMYRDVDLIAPGMEPDRSKADIANDKIEGRTESSFNEDGLRTVFEVYVTTEIDDDLADGAAPYIITIDKVTSNVLSIYRNWDEGDAAQEELQWIVEFPFVPWRGAYPIGMVHMIGGLSAASTGALRALLDSAHISNSQTMLKLKGGTRGGQNLNIQPTQVEEIEGGINGDDIRKLAMPLPFNPPSQTLFQLLGFLVDAGKGVVRTTMDDISDSNQNVPVGTTLAKIEQGMVVFSAIHARLHSAMGRMLRILNRLNGMYLDDEMQVEELGEELVSRKDFNGPLDVIPVSDPNIFSEAQRFAQVQAVAQRADLKPQLYNQRKVEELILSTLKIPDGKALLNAPVEPQEQNAVAENVAATMGKPVVAYPEQDHIAHLKAHLSYMVSPALGASRLMAPTYLPVMINHLKEHIAMWYAAQVYDISNEATGMDIGDALREMKTPEERQAFDRMLAEASTTVASGADQALAALPPVIDQAIDLLQKLAPQPPVDPAVQAAMEETKRRAAADQAKAQNDQGKLQLQDQKAQTDAQIEQERLRIDRERIAAENARNEQDNRANMAINVADNAAAIQITEMEIEAREEVPSPLNPNPTPMS